MALFYKNFGSFTNLFNTVTQQEYELYRQAIPHIFDVFEVFNFNSLRNVIERTICQAKSSAIVVTKDGVASSNCKKLSKRGRSAVDPVLMFKICVLQSLTCLSDNQMQANMNVNMSYRYLLDLDRDYNQFRAPDAKTIWKYREIFTQSGLLQTISEEFMSSLSRNKIIDEDSARVVDSSFVEAPKQHNSAEENKTIKDGNGKSLWPENPNKRRHKDIDATWTKKGGKHFFGYKMHAKISASTKLILSIHVTTASVHDSKVISPLLDQTDKGKLLYADSGYCGKDQESIVKEYGMTPMVCERAYRNHPLNEGQKANNAKKSSLRCRVEHPFAFIENTMGGSIVRSVGQVRATAQQYLTVFAYNMVRCCQLLKQRAKLVCSSRLEFNPTT